MTPAFGVQDLTEGQQLLVCQRPLQPREEAPLLVANVVVEQRPQRVQVSRLNSASYEVGRHAAQLDVFDQNAHDVGIVWSNMPREGGQHVLLLGAEVPARVALEERQESISCHIGVGCGGATQVPRDLQRNVVLP